MISKVQTMRKEAGFEVMDHIAVSMAGNEKIEAVAKANENILKSEVLAEEISYDEAEGYTKQWNINGETVTLGVVKLN